MKKTMLLLFALFVLPRVCFSNSMVEANDLYSVGEYTKAIDSYESLVKQGFVDENLYYNLGNAYFRAEQFGPAIYNYERALRVNPAMGDARANLELSHRKVLELIDYQFLGAEEEPLWVRLSLFWSKGSLMRNFFVLYFILFAGLFVLILKPYTRYRSLWILLVVVATVGALFFGFLWNRHAAIVSERHQALVIVESVQIREAPNARSTERGELYPGIHVRILEIDNTWVRIRLINGLEGWVPRNTLGEFDNQ